MPRFALKDEFIELYKLLKVMDCASTGGEAKMLIEAGEVRVDKVIETRKRCKIRSGQVVQSGSMVITVD